MRHSFLKEVIKKFYHQMFSNENMFSKWSISLFLDEARIAYFKLNFHWSAFEKIYKHKKYSFQHGFMLFHKVMKIAEEYQAALKCFNEFVRARFFHFLIKIRGKNALYKCLINYTTKFNCKHFNSERWVSFVSGF